MNYPASTRRLGVIGSAMIGFRHFCRIAALASIAGAAMPLAAQTLNSVPPWAAAPASTASVEYQVGPGDVLRVDVYRSPDLSSRLVVSQDGAIIFPQLGSVPVAGLTADQIAQGVTRLLRERGILNSPEVSVSVLTIGSNLISVMGAVTRPGEMPLDRPGMTLAAVLAQAGTTFGTGNALVTVVQGRGPDAPREQMLLGDIVSGKSDRPARSGEIVIVQAAPLIYVSGEVGRPGAYPKEPGMTVGQAIAVAGGVTPRGSSNRIRIMHKVAEGTPQTPRSARLEDRIAEGDLILVRTRIF